MNATPSAPAPEVKAEKTEKPTAKPQRQSVSDEEALNIAFNELSALCRKHSGVSAAVAHSPDSQGRFQIFLTGVERVEPPGSATVTLRFKAPAPTIASPFVATIQRPTTLPK